MEITRRKSLEATFAITAGLIVFYYFWRIEYLLIAAIVVAIIGLLLPGLARYIGIAWYKLAELLGRINGTILLSLLFFLFLTPLAWFRKLFSKPPMRLKKDDKQESYFEERSHQYTAEDLSKPW